jgi:hypothetical protein
VNVYVYLKPNTHRSYGSSMDLVTRGQAATDAEAVSLALDGEIVARIIDGQAATREDGQTRTAAAKIPPPRARAVAAEPITDDVPL